MATYSPTCQWEEDCNEPTFGWRFDINAVQWMPVCDQHFSEGINHGEATITPTEVEDLYKAQQEAAR
jgi:hypothetical protein